jgi:ABC-2 type transport system ATP-binding protein
VVVRGLQKSYGGRRVVDGVDLDVTAGEVVGLIGANGAGKTTTVECIQGLRRPDGGTLCVLGFDPVTQRDELRPLIGSQLQSSALPDRLRIGEAVHLFSGGAGGRRRFAIGAWTPIGKTRKEAVPGPYPRYLASALLGAAGA